MLLALCTGYAQDFTVNLYSVDITIHPEGYFDVAEKYDLDFEIEKHGIYRNIQTRYDLLNEAGLEEERKIRISHIEVPGYKFEAPFDFIQKLTDQMDIKIGDEDITLIGPQHYEIRYRVHNAFLFEDSLIRFYWNIKPGGWAADFHKINFRVRVPEGIALSEETCFVYSGIQGATEQSSDFKLGFAGGIVTGLSRDGFISRPGESVTVLINLPANSISEEKPFWPFWDAYGWLFIIVLLAGSFFMVWRKFGRDDRVVSTTSYYPPEDIDPAMAGFLMDDKSDASDLIALIPHWGAKGHLMMEEVPKKGLFGKKDTRLVMKSPIPATSPDYARVLFTGLFGSDSVLRSGDTGPSFTQKEVLVSTLKNTFYTTMNSARSQLKEKAQPYYVAESRKVQRIMMAMILLLGIAGTLAGLFYWGPLAAFGVAVSTGLLLALNFYMVKRNAVGNRLLSELKGFKRFIKVAEENKLKMLIKDDPGYFEHTMGYALAFGLFDKWSQKFRDLDVPPPNWYRSTGTGQFTMYHFSRSFSGTISGVTTNMVSSPSRSSSSGGGSSGGGFGGGGGGSW
jgi:uncharacterized membrane protein YgcG